MESFVGSVDPSYQGWTPLEKGGHNATVSAQRFTGRVGPDQSGQRLDLVAGLWLASALGRTLSKSAVRRLLMGGAVSVDGRLERRPGLLLAAGQRLEARVLTERLERSGGASTRGGIPAGDADVAVLFEDRWLIAVSKPPGLQTHASADPSRPDLFGLVSRRLAPAAEGRAYLALHHRLDVGTSGVVLFATDPAANAGLARAFAERRVAKTYEALTVRPATMPTARWTSRGSLAATGSGRRARVGVVAGGQPAETAFRVVGQFARALHVEAIPKTGRKHQIRAHLAAAGLPILGDRRYGGPSSIAGATVPRVMLHAATIRFDHPVTGCQTEIRAPRPSDFQDMLDRLERVGR
jgi:RluA family pseudouridine synthase